MVFLEKNTTDTLKVSSSLAQTDHPST